MKGFVGVTDNDWFAFLSQQQAIDEVNFWQPGGTGLFRAMEPGEPFLFNVDAPLQVDIRQAHSVGSRRPKPIRPRVQTEKDFAAS